MSPPSLLLFFHVPKTGGSSVREILLRNAGVRSAWNASRRLSAVVRFWDAPCFVCLQFRGFPGCDESLTAKCASWKPRVAPPAYFNSSRDDWRTSQVAVEFHGGSHAFFTSHVLPHVGLLRREYAQLGGTVVTATVLREPISYLFSSYHMYPPLLPGRRPDGATPFPQWVAHAAGLQVGHMLNCTAVTPRGGMHSACGCAEAARTRAMGALARIDVVGLTSCLPSFLDAIEARMRWDPDPPQLRLQRRAARRSETLEPLHSRPPCGAGHAPCQSVRRWTWDALNASSRSLTRRVAEACDAALYAEAARRARSDRGVGGEAACQPPPPPALGV